MTNRGVVFKRAYWARVVELFDLMDRAGRARALEAARSNRLGRKTLSQLKDVDRAADPGPMTLEAVDEVAKRYGLWETRAPSIGAPTLRWCCPRPACSMRRSWLVSTTST